MKINTAMVKLASLAVHAGEVLDGLETGQPLQTADVAAIRGLLRDKEVQAVLRDMDEGCLLPVRRDAQTPWWDA